jgi:glutathione synthase/RimK-type ligase-like ATP-grasp enzyme
MKLCFLTLDDRTDFVIDDDVGIAEFRRRGIVLEEIPWRRPDVDWRAYDAVIIRTPWDYQKDVDAFLALLDRIEALGVPLANPAKLVRWNARKTYLRDLAARGVDIVPTHWGQGITPEELRALPAQFGVGECVIKPVVSANADDTYRIVPTLSDADARRIAGCFPNRAWMAQPFIDSVVEEGEQSLFYFSGVYSHAVNKRPKSGDFRVQEEHGGIITPITPDAALRAAADRVMAALGEAPLQARVDLVRLDNGPWALMELEAIEPSLYFAQHPDAPRHFADAVLRWVADDHRRAAPRSPHEKGG